MHNLNKNVYTSQDEKTSRSKKKQIEYVGIAPSIGRINWLVEMINAT